VRAHDFGFVQEYRDIMRFIESSYIDRRNTELMNSSGNGQESASVELQKVEGRVPLSSLKTLCKNIGLLDVPQELYSTTLFEEIQQSDLGDILVLVTQEAFQRFCQKHFIDDFTRFHC